MLDMILFTTGVKSIQDIPDLPMRDSNDAAPARSAVPLSLTDARDMIFG